MASATSAAQSAPLKPLSVVSETAPSAAPSAGPVVDLMRGGALTIGASGARVTRDFVPADDSFSVEELRGVSGIAARAVLEPNGHNQSDMVLSGRQKLPAQTEAGKLAYYKAHGGTVHIDGEQGRWELRLLPAAHGYVGVARSGDRVAFDPAKVEIRYGRVDEDYEIRPNAVVRYQVKQDVTNAGVLQLMAHAAMGQHVTYRMQVVGIDGENITVRAIPMADVDNQTGADILGKKVELVLNDGPELRHGRFADKSRAYIEEQGAFSGGVQESEATNLLTLAIAERFNCKAGRSQTIMFPQDKEKGYDVWVLRQEIVQDISVRPSGREGSVAVLKDAHPDVSYVVPETDWARPRGEYQLFEGRSPVPLKHRSARYTELGEEVTMLGKPMFSISTDARTQAVVTNATEWVDADEAVGIVRRLINEKREVTYAVTAESKVCNVGKFDRKVTLQFHVGSFDRGVSNIQAVLNGEALADAEVKYNADERKISVSFIAPKQDNEKMELGLAFIGTETQHRTVRPEVIDVDSE